MDSKIMHKVQVVPYFIYFILSRVYIIYFVNYLHK